MSLVVPHPPQIEFNRNYLPRSIISRTESLVLFRNLTSRQVNIYWLDFNGDEALYGTLNPHGKVKVNTYCYHPWVFRDFNTGQLMHAFGANIFWPMLCKIRDPRHADRWLNQRMQVNILLPIRTLREMCMWRVAKIFHKATEPKHQLQLLSIPYTLKTDIDFILDSILNYSESMHNLVPMTNRNE